MKRGLGVCYYPEHWPEAVWAEDARRMADLGLTWVRIGEFAWSRVEPEPGRLDWGWLDRAMDVLGRAGLRVVLGTPTATPPRWMLDRHPDMLAVDADGRPRGFGSRRHYCFSHAGYRAEAARIAGLYAERYAAHPALGLWQTDNEYGCHDTVLSHSNAARAAFRLWLADRYGTVGALNAAWGNVFWSMDYRAFEEIDLPVLTVTEPNPAHALAFRRFSSDQVVAWNAAQVAAIRAHSDAPISHNYMGRVLEFDHWALGDGMEVATWDSYPLGFLLDRVPEGDVDAYLRQGDPDFQAFHHDLYRGVGHGRWWIMEQQPGPVNWAPHNPAPLPGMERLWAWEAFAHGAETVAWFRWRQFPQAQEQHHAGLLRPDGVEAPAFREVAAVAGEIGEGAVPEGNAPVAIVFDYDSQWAWEVQPQGAFDHFGLCFALYRALRRLGQSVDIVRPGADLSPYALTFAPGLLTLDGMREALAAAPGHVVTGPRTDLKTPEMGIAVPLGPDVGLDATAVLVETFPDARPLERGGAAIRWLERIETTDAVVERTVEGDPVLIRRDARWHLAAWPDPDAAERIVGDLLRAADLSPLALEPGVRVRDAGPERIVLNHAAVPRRFENHDLPPAGVLRLAR